MMGAGKLINKLNDGCFNVINRRLGRSNIKKQK